MNIGLIAHPRYVAGLHQAGFVTTSGPDVKAASMAVKPIARDMPVLVIEGDDYSVPSPVRQFVEISARQALFLTERDFPITVATLSTRLGVPVATEGSLGADGTFTPDDATTAPVEDLDEDLDDWDDDWDDNPDPDSHDEPAAVAPEPIEYEHITGLGFISEPEAYNVELVDESEESSMTTTGHEQAAPPEELHYWQQLEQQGSHLLQETPAPTPTATAPAQQTPKPDPDGFVAIASTPTAKRSRREQPRPTLTGEAKILISCAAGGGVGKSVSTLVLAQMAAETGLRVCVVDLNRGQPDLAKYVLRSMNTSTARTVHNVTFNDDVHAAVTTADEANQYRRSNGATGDVSFDSVFSPDGDLYSKVVHNSALYGHILVELRSEYDLMILDTQVLDHDRSDLWDELLIPYLKAGEAWAMCLTDSTPAKQASLFYQLEKLTAEGVPNAKLVTVGTQFADWNEASNDAFARLYGPYTFLGATRQSALFRQDVGSGFRIATDNPDVAPVMRRVLERMYGPIFAPVEVKQPRSLGGMFKRGGGR